MGSALDLGDLYSLKTRAGRALTDTDRAGVVIDVIGLGSGSVGAVAKFGPRVSELVIIQGFLHLFQGGFPIFTIRGGRVGRLIEHDSYLMRARNFPEWPPAFVPSEEPWREFGSSLLRIIQAGVTGIVGVVFFYCWMEFVPRFLVDLLGILMAIWAIAMSWLILSGSKRFFRSRRRLRAEFLRWSREQRRLEG